MKLIAVFLILFQTSALVALTADYLPVPANDLVKHTYYTLSYNEKNEQANWVYYTLTDGMVSNGGGERSNNFRMDQKVPTRSAKSSDYTKSGYDRGHLCPAADMGFNQVSMEESFLMSNISPQVPDFNRGIWKELESQVRDWARKEQQLVVVTGPVFKDNKGVIGQEEVVVPGYYFKLIYDATDEPRLIAFVLPNSKSDRPLTDFAVAADEVEKLTGFDFFSQFPDEVESKLESRVDLAGWFEGYVPAGSSAEQAPEVQQADRSDSYFYLILLFVVLSVSLVVYLKGRKNTNQ